ncbi:MAG: hypothetical protein IJB83_03485 [Bacilli bacterium]|nr:hypothetical protein [Bacilli bacterium]
MKKIDIENNISNHILKNNIILKDKLNKTKKFNNLTELKTFFKSNLLLYKDKIEPYANYINAEITKIESWITSLMELEDEDTLKRNIESNIRNKLGLDYNNSKKLNFIFIDSLNENKSYKSFTVLKYIYDKYDIRGIEIYINLLTSNSNLTSTINSSDEIEREVAFSYLGFRIGENDYKSLTRKSVSKTEIDKINNAYSTAITAIENEKQEYIEYMSEVKKAERDWFEKVRTDYSNFSNDAKVRFDSFEEDAERRLQNIEKTYEEKLKVIKPAEHMQNEANKYKAEVKKYSFIVGGIVIFIIILLYLIISPKIEFGDKTILEITIFNNNINIPAGFIIISIISIALYFLRIFVKLLMSSKHLETEYKQKYALTYFYLSLINNGNLTDEEVNNKILALLFSSADTGLIKGETSSSDIEKILYAMMGTKNR